MYPVVSITEQAGGHGGFVRAGASISGTHIFTPKLIDIRGVDIPERGEAELGETQTLLGHPDRSLRAYFSITLNTVLRLYLLSGSSTTEDPSPQSPSGPP